MCLNCSRAKNRLDEKAALGPVTQNTNVEAICAKCRLLLAENDAAQALRLAVDAVEQQQHETQTTAAAAAAPIICEFCRLDRKANRAFLWCKIQALFTATLHSRIGQTLERSSISFAPHIQTFNKSRQVGGRI